MNLRKIVKNEILTTQGVKSYVLDGDTIQGHVFLGDLDGISQELIMYEFGEMPGINILWRSSDKGYHIWNLTIRSLDETALIGLKSHTDCKHVSHGYKFKRWVLRITPKWTSERGAYKDEPSFIQSWYNKTSRFQSKAHYWLFKAMTHTTIKNTQNAKFKGSTLKIDEYMTITDEMKKQMRDK